MSPAIPPSERKSPKKSDRKHRRVKPPMLNQEFVVRVSDRRWNGVPLYRDSDGNYY